MYFLNYTLMFLKFFLTELCLSFLSVAYRCYLTGGSRTIAPWTIAPRIIAAWIIAPRTIAPQDNCPPGQFPPGQFPQG